MKTEYSWVLRILVTVFFAMNLSAQDPLLRVPNEKEFEEERMLMREIFSVQYEKDSPEERSILADQLYQTALAAKDDMNGRYVLLWETKDLCIELGRLKRTLEAIDQLIKFYAVDPVELQLSSLEKIHPTLTEKEDFIASAHRLLIVKEQSLLRGVPSKGLAASFLAITMAKQADDFSLISSARAAEREMKTLHQEWIRVEEAKATLRKEPKDPPSHLRIGRYLCIIEDRWVEGLRHLARSEHKTLRPIAKKEIDSPGEPEARLELARMWFQQSNQEQKRSKTALRIRAAHWYLLALKALPEADQAKLQKKIDSTFSPEELVKASLAESKPLRPEPDPDPDPKLPDPKLPDPKPAKASFPKKSPGKPIRVKRTPLPKGQGIRVERHPNMHVYRLVGKFSTATIGGLLALNDTIYVGTSAGLLHYDPQKRKWEIIESPAPNSWAEELYAIRGRVVASFIAKQPSNRKQYLGLFQLDESTWSPLPTHKSKPVLWWSGPTVFQGHVSHGLVQWNLKTGESISMTAQEGGLLHNRISSLATSGDGVLWISLNGSYDSKTYRYRGGGISRYEPERKIWERFTREQGVADEYCCDLKVDDLEVWVVHSSSRSKGVSIYDRIRKTWKHIRKSQSGNKLSGRQIELDPRSAWLLERHRLIRLDRRSQRSDYHNLEERCPEAVFDRIVRTRDSIWILGDGDSKPDRSAIVRIPNR
jgi:hypothetical protein